MLSFLMDMARHTQSTQNKYAVSLQYLKKELGSEVDVLHADKHQSLLQVDTNFFDVVSQACPNFADKLRCLQ